MSRLDSFERQWQRWFPEDRDEKSERGTRRRGTVTKIILVLIGVLALVILVNMAKGFYSEWLWFNSLGYGSVYATILRTKVLIFFSAAIIFGLLFLGGRSHHRGENYNTQYRSKQPAGRPGLSGTSLPDGMRG